MRGCAVPGGRGMRRHSCSVRPCRRRDGGERRKASDRGERDQSADIEFVVEEPRPALHTASNGSVVPELAIRSGNAFLVQCPCNGARADACGEVTENLANGFRLLRIDLAIPAGGFATPVQILNWTDRQAIGTFAKGNTSGGVRTGASVSVVALIAQIERERLAQRRPPRGSPYAPTEVKTFVFNARRNVLQHFDVL